MVFVGTGGGMPPLGGAVGPLLIAAALVVLVWGLVELLRAAGAVLGQAWRRRPTRGRR